MPRLFAKAREPFSSYSHFIGAVLSAVGLLAMVVHMERFGASVRTAVSVLVFCLSLIGLYTASSVYHFSCRAEGIIRRLKKLDHSMIYVLIAGSYTPVVLRFMPSPKSVYFTLAIWAVALFGIAVKLLWIDAPRMLGTALYLLVGWAIMVDFGTILRMPGPAVALLAAGGILYTLGGIVYIVKKPDLGIGFHELFHLFVIAGSACHYWMVFRYVL